MSTAHAHSRHRHEAGFYASDEEFLALTVPFLEAGVAAGEPVFARYDDRKTALLRSALGDEARMTVLDPTQHATPARAIEQFRRVVADHVANGAVQVRISGEVPHAGNGGRFEGWDRYESAVNVAWDDLPIRSLCLYDAATIPDDVRDVVERTHRRLVSADGAVKNPRYESPDDFAPLAPEADPLESSPPSLELDDPTPRQARHAVAGIAGGVDAASRDDLLLCVSEAVTNAHMHGRPPITLRAWAAADRVVVHVGDHGPGPSSWLTGLVPSASAEYGGRGLWIAHQLLDVAYLSRPGGFTVRLRTL